MQLGQGLRVINTQLGFRNRHGAKRIIVPDLPETVSIFGSRLFMVFEQNDFSKYGLNDPAQLPFTHRAGLERQHTDFGTWLVGDFSHVDRTGVYQAICGNEPGPSFAIRDDVYLRVLPECLRYFQVQSCGRSVPGWHPSCHLDDGYIVEEDRYLDAAGGWHDAGDFRKWATSTALNAIALLIGHRLWSGREEQLGLAPGVLLDEAMQGVHYFLNIQHESGALYHNIGGGRDTWHDNLDCRYTDNVKHSGDERRIWPEPGARPAGKFTALYAMYAHALAGRDGALSERCLAAAKRSLEFDLGTHSHSADALQWRAWAYLELWRATGEGDYQAAAVRTLDALLDLQVIDYVGGQRAVRGWFRDMADSDQMHRKHVGWEVACWVLAEATTCWADHEKAGRWRDALAMWVEDFVEPFASRNPFGILPYALYHRPPAENPHTHYRRLGDELYFRYFLRCKHMSNARYSLAAAALAGTAGVLQTHRNRCLDHAYRLLEWTLGNNPFQLSTMNGVGVIQPCALAFQTGNIPGGVTLGIGGDDQDMPCYPHPFACSDEYYGYQTSHFTWALLALQNVEYAGDER